MGENTAPIQSADLSGIVERLEKATGPDQEIDRLIHFHVEAPWLAEKCIKWVPAYFEEPNSFLWWTAERAAEGKEGYHGEWVSYTSSIDNALTLIEEKLPDWIIANMGQDDNKRWHAELRKGFATSFSTVELAGAPSLELALLIAALKALRTLQSKGEA